MSFFGKADQEFDVKFIFDHLRNIGICVAIALSAKSIFENHTNEQLLEFVAFPVLTSYLLAIASGLLLTLNLTQVVYLLAGKLNNKSRMSWVNALVLIIFLVPIYFATLALFWARFFA